MALIPCGDNQDMLYKTVERNSANISVGRQLTPSIVYIRLACAKVGDI